MNSEREPWRSVSRSQAELSDAVRWCLESDLTELALAGNGAKGLPGIVRCWRLGDGDKDALLRYGIPVTHDDPDGVQMVGDLQSVVEPTVLVDGIPGYRLGTHWRRTLTALVDTGEVMAVPAQAGDRRILLTGEFGPPLHVNSSVARFVDIAWRWHCLGPIFLESDYGSAFEEGVEAFLDALPRLDPALADEGEYSYWRDLMLGW